MKLIRVLLGIYFLILSAAAGAACTYSEAVMALERGNMTRGLALMKMAANDGDIRAVRYVTNIQRNSTLRLTNSQTGLDGALIAKANE